MTLPELLDWCEEHHRQNVYVHHNREEGQVSLFAHDGALTINTELWDEFVTILTEHRPDVYIEPEL